MFQTYLMEKKNIKLLFFHNKISLELHYFEKEINALLDNRYKLSAS